MIQVWPHDDGTFSVSDGRGWLPGTFESRATARYAAEHSDPVFLETLCGPGKVITMAQLLADEGSIERPDGSLHGSCEMCGDITHSTNEHPIW